MRIINEIDVAEKHSGAITIRFMNNPLFIASKSPSERREYARSFEEKCKSCWYQCNS
jgi:hypothetical protein